LNSSEFPPGFENESKNLAIDFDGVIHNNDKGYFNGTCYGELISGAFDSIVHLSKTYEIIVFTAKAKPSRPLVGGKTGEQLVWEWLESKGLSSYVKQVTSEKPRAIAYIDDKAIRFESWEKTIQELAKDSD
jgi:hypothetical protein